MAMESMLVTPEEKWLIEMLREKNIDRITVCEALKEYGRGIAENVYFKILADPDNYKVNEEGVDLMEKAINGFINGKHDKR